MSVTVDLQLAEGAGDAPSQDRFEAWALAAVAGRRGECELSVRVVGSDESRELNRRYRDKDRPTNVLAFPADMPPGPAEDLLGDLVICGDVVREEAAAQGKPEPNHWAHLVVHGTLHLLGYDHETQAGALEMEQLETAVLAGLGVPNPYQTPQATG